MFAFSISLVLASTLAVCVAFSGPQPTTTTTRRAVLGSAIAWTGAHQVSALAFEGTGSSSYSGRTPATTAAKAANYRARIAADVKDFNALGAAIDKGETAGEAWIAFFIPYQRREPDSVGRTYAAQVDLVGADRAGGAALLLAGTYAKPNKPPDNLPQYKKYNALVKTLAPIQNAGKAGDSAKAKQEWSKAALALTEFLDSVEMPSELSDPLYK